MVHLRKDGGGKGPGIQDTPISGAESSLSRSHNRRLTAILPRVSQDPSPPSGGRFPYKPWLAPHPVVTPVLQPALGTRCLTRVVLVRSMGTRNLARSSAPDAMPRNRDPRDPEESNAGRGPDQPPERETPGSVRPPGGIPPELRRPRPPSLGPVPNPGSPGRPPVTRPEGRGPFLPASHFRVALGEEEVGVRSISALEWNGGAARAGPPDSAGPSRPPSPSPGSEGRGPPSARPELPAQTVTLSRGVDGSRAFYAWHRAVVEGKEDVRTVRIVLLATAGGPPIYGWSLIGARPMRWSGPRFDAMTPEIATEELVIAYERVDWIELRRP